jgi:TDG/mug DNA glycosylase family protein
MPGSTDTGFPYVARPDARILILGSMPGTASLAANRYYAHPRNAFWPITGELFGFDAKLPYDERLEALKRNRVALWDVAHRCIRPGSLDSNIDRESIEPNDFAAFFEAHPHIRAVFFNGSAAESLFRKLVLPTLPEKVRHLPMKRLPSTSPAHAARSFADKLAAWRPILDALHRDRAQGLEIRRRRPDKRTTPPGGHDER